MSTKTQLLEILAKNQTTYTSGAKLAAELTISRNAVWKAIENLREDGYSIAAATNKGYRLTYHSDILTEASITSHIMNTAAYTLDVRKTVTSTNAVLRELATAGAPEGYVVVADEQTSGKGRMGRTFHSPAGHGVYFSILLRPGPKSADASLITSAAAVAAAQAIEEVLGMSVGIKWVNDLFLDGKKVCGILTEASFDMENGYIESAILGIGINVTTPDDGYPDEIKDIAVSLASGQSATAGERCRLIASTLDNFWGYYADLSERRFLDEYRKRSILIGRSINVITHDGIIKAQAIAIDDDCRLIVRYENGETRRLNSGEVSVRQ